MTVYTLDEIIEITNGGSWTEAEYSASEKDIYVVKVTNMVNGSIAETPNDSYLPESLFNKYKNHQLKSGDICIATVGSHPSQQGSVVGRTIKIQDVYSGSFLNQNAAILRPKDESILANSFFYYLTKTIFFKHHVESRARGSANQVRMAIGELKRFNFNYPDIQTQKKVAAILSAYDDLIENNKKRIQILENMAEELYKEWFVRFRFPNWENTEFEKGVPEDWTYVNLLELADITYGYAFDSIKFNTESIGRKIIRIRNIPISRSSDYTDEVPHDKYLIQTGDLLVGMDGDFHMNRWFDEESYLVQRSCRIKSKLNIHSAYIRQAIKAPIHFFQSTILGATVGHLGAKHLNSIEILMPSSNHENLFSELNQLDKLSLNLELQNRKLEVMRDNLLPRLISGKLSVENLDIQFPTSMQEQ